MNKHECVNCRNKNNVNVTNNRLVTESCGHVKCMQCLLQEKSGCAACIAESKELIENNLEGSNRLVDHIAGQIGSGDYNVLGDHSPLEDHNENEDHNISRHYNGLEDHNGVDHATNEVEVYKSDKKKPDTPHIRVEIVGKTKKYECLVCKKKFHSRSMVAYHSYCNGQQKPYQCPIAECKKSFISLSYYRYHMRVHRDERVFACDICGKSFFQKSKMERHRLRHSKTKQCICTKCGKGFSNSTALQRHLRTHSDERPYHCNLCQRRFRDGSNYRKHVLKHEKPSTGDSSPSSLRSQRAHSCGRCAQAFQTRKDLRRHMQVHTDAKPFRCKACTVERRFRRKDNLDRHIRNTHPELALTAAAAVDDGDDVDIHENGHADSEVSRKKITDDASEKKKLEILNPLPPLPQEVIARALTTDNTMTIDSIIDHTIDNMHMPAEAIDKSYILEANNARQSVIVETQDRKIPSPMPEYVHKIRKANSMRSQKDTSLPPIDPIKIIELETKTTQNNLDIGVPLPKNIATYKNILYDEMEKNGGEEATAPKMHWRRKMKLGINW